MNETEQILTHVLGCRRVDLYTERKALTAQQKERVDRITSYLKRGMPLQYALGEVDFCGLTLNIDSRALIPRPETELLVEEAMHILFSSSSSDQTVLDLGTGSGNIAISLAKFFSRCRIIAVDASEDALSLARENARSHAVAEQIEFVHADMARWLQTLPDRTCSMIISNPPYIPSGQLAALPADVQQEPGMALDGGEDGLDFYRAIIAQAGRVLSFQGHLLFEFWDGQDAAIEAMLRSDRSHTWNVRFLKDFSCVNRILVAQLQTS